MQLGENRYIRYQIASSSVSVMPLAHSLVYYALNRSTTKDKLSVVLLFGCFSELLPCITVCNAEFVYSVGMSQCSFTMSFDPTNRFLN